MSKWHPPPLCIILTISHYRIEMWTPQTHATRQKTSFVKLEKRGLQSSVQILLRCCENKPDIQGFFFLTQKKTKGIYNFYDTSEGLFLEFNPGFNFLNWWLLIYQNLTYEEIVIPVSSAKWEINRNSRLIAYFCTLHNVIAHSAIRCRSRWRYAWSLQWSENVLIIFLFKIFWSLR